MHHNRHSVRMLFRANARLFLLPVAVVLLSSSASFSQMEVDNLATTKSASIEKHSTLNLLFAQATSPPNSDAINAPPPDPSETVPRDQVPRDATILNLQDTPIGKEPANAPQGTNCGNGIFDPCGIVYNRSGSTLQLWRESSSRYKCTGNNREFRDLPNGQNSNSYGSPRWRDVDCVRSQTAWIVTNGTVYRPGSWIRVWTPKWIY